MSNSNESVNSVFGHLAHNLMTVLIGPSPKSKKPQQSHEESADEEALDVSLREKQLEREKQFRERIAAYSAALWCPEGQAALKYFDLDPESWSYKQAVYRSNHLQHMGQFDLIPYYDDDRRKQHLSFLKELYLSYSDLIDPRGSVVTAAKGDEALEYDNGRRHFWKVALNKLDDAQTPAA